MKLNIYTILSIVRRILNIDTIQTIIGKNLTFYTTKHKAPYLRRNLKNFWLIDKNLNFPLSYNKKRITQKKRYSSSSTRLVFETSLSIKT